MAVQDYYAKDRSEVAPFIPSEYSRVLEIGCGEGVFSANLKSGCEIWGIEPNAEACKVAVSRGYKGLVGTYDQNLDELPDDYFDLVICNDVIEHMTDHDFFFNTIKDKMKGNASLVGSIPNVRYYPILKNLLLHSDWKYEDWGVLDRTHMRFFTEKSLQRCFSQHGFVIKKFSGINKLKIKKPRDRALFALIQLLTFFKSGDISYIQFGFQVQKAS